MSKFECAACGSKLYGESDIPGHVTCGGCTRSMKYEEIKNDMVNHPSHYTQGGIECIDGIQAALTPEQFQGFCRGNAMKYIWRVGNKGNYVQDIDKANWYLKKARDSKDESSTD